MEWKSNAKTCVGLAMICNTRIGKAKNSQGMEKHSDGSELTGDEAQWRSKAEHSEGRERTSDEAQRNGTETKGKETALD